MGTSTLELSAHLEPFPGGIQAGSVCLLLRLHSFGVHGNAFTVSGAQAAVRQGGPGKRISMRSRPNLIMLNLKNYVAKDILAVHRMIFEASSL